MIYKIKIKGSTLFLFFNMMSSADLLYILVLIYFFSIIISIFVIKLYYLYNFRAFISKCVELLALYRVVDLQNKYVIVLFLVITANLTLLFYLYLIFVFPTPQIIALQFLFQVVILFSTLCFLSEFKRSNETIIFKRLDILFYFCTFFLLLEYYMYTVAIPCYYILGFFEQNFWIINISLGFVLLLLTDTFSYKKFEK